MRILIIITALLVAHPSSGYSQEGKKLTSTTLNIELPDGSSRENRRDEIKKYNERLDYFAAEKGYKTRKEDVEILYNIDHASFLATLTEHKFNVSQEAADLYKIAKGKNQWLLYIPENSSACLQQSNIISPLKLSILSASLFSKHYRALRIIIIKRIY